jgi:hypothetical protein
MQAELLAPCCISHNVAAAVAAVVVSMSSYFNSQQICMWSNIAVKIATLQQITVISIDLRVVSIADAAYIIATCEQTAQRDERGGVEAA